MNKIILSKFDILPNTNITSKLYELFSNYKENTAFIFEEGDYYFSPTDELKADINLSNTCYIPLRTLGIYMKNMQNCIIEGNGAKFWFEGHMQPLTLTNCENIKVKDLTINWKKPLVAEGIVMDVSDTYIDFYVSSENFPHRILDNVFEFDVGADEWYPLNYRCTMVYEPHYRTVRRNTGDKLLSIEGIEKTDKKDIYRFLLREPSNVLKGDILVLRHNERYHAGIFTEKCKDISFENITIHSCGGLGCLSQFCENMRYNKIYFVPDRTLGRFVTNGRDDGMHITCNKGKVEISECAFLGLMDDPINVHGCCVTGDELVDGKTIKCHYRHPEAMGFSYWAEEGDEIAFINRHNMARVGTAKAKLYTLKNREEFTLEFNEALNDEVLALIKDNSLALDNLTNTCEFVCRNNRFGSCRARGLLVSTPKPVLIENNYFESSGSAILLAGDANNWYESGECNDVIIRNNVFTGACLTSNYQYCGGIISLCPTIPNPEIDKPFHKNITIINNTFDTADTPVLYALSCKNLVFKDNTIFKSNAAEKWHNESARISLNYCIDAEIDNNKWIGNFSGELIKNNI